MGMTLNDAKTIMDTFQAFMTGLAIIGAGVWFWRRRLMAPRAAVSHRTHHVPLPDGRHVLRVLVSIANQGEVLLRVSTGFTRVQQLAPMHPYVENEVRRTPAGIAGAQDFPWVMLGKREWANLCHIEPGETQLRDCDFIIPSGVTQVIIYTYVANQKQTKAQIGWDDSITVSLEGETSMSGNKQQSGERQGGNQPRETAVDKSPHTTAIGGRDLTTAQQTAKPDPPPPPPDKGGK